MKNISVVGAEGDCDVESLKENLQKIGVLGVDAQVVCGKEHLIAAANYAAKSFSNKKNICATLAMETMLYASGERQISKASEKMSIKNSKSIALVIFDQDADAVLDDLKLNRNDSLIEASDDKLIRYGISKKEIESVPEHKKYDLVLEHVAFATLRNK